MPGITGFIRKEWMQHSEADIRRMVSCMLHEKFYSSGYLIRSNLGLGVGWVNHEGSQSDCNPIWNNRGDIGLVFSGDIFNENVGNSGCDLLEQYEDDPVAFCESLNGTFSGLLIDLRTSDLILFNDRFGLSRIYFHENIEGFFFSSEAKSLLAILPHLRELDPQGLGEFFSLGCVLQNRSLFKGISLLPAASSWIFSRQKVARKISYFNHSKWENQSTIPANEYYEKLNAVFSKILPRYVNAHEAVGLSLTGGLDSRMIIACKEKLPDYLPCYTFGGPYRDCADVRIARILANQCGHPHSTINVTPDFFTQFPELARKTVFTTDGSMDVMGSVEVFVNRVARHIARIRMTGNYGSEILRRNIAFKPMAINRKMFEGSFATNYDRAKSTYLAERGGNINTFIAAKQIPWYHHGRWAVEQTQLIPRSPYLDNEIVALAYQAPSALSVNRELAHRFIGTHNPELAGIPTDRGATGRNGSRTNSLSSIFQEVMPKLEYLFDYGMPQCVAKYESYIAPLRIERFFLGRQKFYHFRIWYREQLSGYVKERLLDPVALGRNYLNAPQVKKMVENHLNKMGNYTLEIHKLLSSELIQSELLNPN